MGGEGIHRNQAQLLRPCRCSWVELKVVLKIELITSEWSSWKHSTRLIYLSFGSSWFPRLAQSIKYNYK